MHMQVGKPAVQQHLARLDAGLIRDLEFSVACAQKGFGIPRNRILFAYYRVTFAIVKRGQAMG